MHTPWQEGVYEKGPQSLAHAIKEVENFKQLSSLHLSYYPHHQ